MELLIVIVLLTILIGGSYWLVSLYKKEKMEMFVRQLVNDVQYAKSLAYKNGSATVSFVRDCGGGLSCYRIISGKYKKEIYLPDYVKFSNNKEIKFKENLTIAGRGDSVFIVSSYGRYKLIWDNISGNVRWEKIE